MDNLPDEILLEITSNMDISTLRDFSRTNKRHYNIVLTELEDRAKTFGISVPKQLTPEDVTMLFKKLKFLEDLVSINGPIDVQYYTFDWLWDQRPLIKSIIDEGVDHRTNGHPGGSSLLLDHAHHDNAMTVKLLLDLGANPNGVTGREGYHVFTFTENPQIIATALAFGADPIMQDSDAGRALVNVLEIRPDLADQVLHLLTSDPTYLSDEDPVASILRWYIDNWSYDIQDDLIYIG